MKHYSIEEVEAILAYIDLLQQQRHILQTTLEFYADPAIYQETRQGKRTFPAACIADEGSRARNALRNTQRLNSLNHTDGQKS